MGYRKILIRLFTFLGGIYFFLRFVLPENIGGTPSAENPSIISGGFEFGKYNQQISDGFVLVGAMAIGLGLVNLLLVHGSKVVFRRKGWPFSTALLLGLISMLAATSADWHASYMTSKKIEQINTLRSFSDAIQLDYKANRNDVKPWHERNAALLKATEDLLSQIDAQTAATKITDLKTDNRLENELNSDLIKQSKETRMALAAIKTQAPSDASMTDVALSMNKSLSQRLTTLAQAQRALLEAQYNQSNTKKIYNLLSQGFFTSLGSAMFALLGFYIAAAAYRAFRIRSAESALMMTAALLVMLGQIPFGIWLWDGFPELRLWLLQIPNSAASRAVEMGAAVAGVVMAFRMWFSIESESFK